MKYNIIIYISMIICVSVLLCSENSNDATEVAYHKAIDKLFTQAQESLTAKKDIITTEWLACDEMKEVKNVMSDLSIDLGFNVHAKKEVVKRLQGHLETEIRNAVQKIFENDEAQFEHDGTQLSHPFNDNLRQFLYLSETVCKLSEGVDSEYMMRGIKDDSFPHRQHAKTKEKMRQQVRKENMRRLCKIVELGAQPR